MSLARPRVSTEDYICWIIAMKLLARILDKRLREIMEQELGARASGEYGRGSTDWMFSLRQFSVNRLRCKETWLLVFVNLGKSFTLIWKKRDNCYSETDGSPRSGRENDRSSMREHKGRVVFGSEMSVKVPVKIGLIRVTTLAHWRAS